MIYYCIFLSSGFSAWVAEYFFKRKSQTLGVFFSILSILILTWICGARDLSIGTDIRVYGNTTFQTATVSPSFSKFIDSLTSIYGSSGETEFGYLFLNFIVSRFTNNTHIFLFILGLVINSLIYVSIYLMRNEIGLTLPYLTYCFLFFGTTLNLLRQSVALSFVLLGVVLLYKKKEFMALACILIALTFHNSSIFALIIYLFGILINYSRKQKDIKRIIVIFTLLILLLPTIISFLNAHGMLNDKYYQYVSVSNNNSNLLSILMRLPMVILIILNKRKNLNNSKILLYMLVIFELIMVPLQSIGKTVARLMLFFGITKIVAYPLALNDFPITHSSIKFLLKICYLIMIMFIFYEQAIIGGNNQIYPFIFG